MYSSSFICALILCCFLRVFSLEPSNNGGFTIEIFHRDSSHSPLYDAADMHYDRLRRAIKRSFDGKSAMSASASAQSYQSLLRSTGGEYLMKFLIGTPPVEQIGIGDTGSDLTWIQCRPCSKCFKQKVAIFNPRQSKTYRKIPCKSANCTAADGHPCLKKRRCRYHISYIDNSYSKGDFSSETFSFQSSNASFPRTIFGCSHYTGGSFYNAESGIIGLGGGALSLIKQLNNATKGKFSYCLTLPSSNAAGRISFGSNAVTNAVKTPIVNKQPDTFYYLTLKAISVADQRIEYKSSTEWFEKGNIIFDSGTTLTYLNSKIVGRIEAAMNKHIEGERVKDRERISGLCYNRPENGKVKVPQVTMHFEGADVELAEEGLFVETDDEVWCLTFARTNDLAIYGNFHQMNYEVGYDLVKKEVSFLRTDCSDRSVDV